MSVIDCFSLAVLTVDCAVRTTVRQMFTKVLVMLHFDWYGETITGGSCHKYKFCRSVDKKMILVAAPANDKT